MLLSAPGEDLAFATHVPSSDHVTRFFCFKQIQYQVRHGKQSSDYHYVEQHQHPTRLYVESPSPEHRHVTHIDSLSTSPLTTPHQSGQRQEDILQLCKVWSPKPSDRIPASRGIKRDRLATALIEAGGNIVEGFGVGVEGWVDPADCGFAVLDACFVDLEWC
jgi:hypothetical protein